VAVGLADAVFLIGAVDVDVALPTVPPGAAVDARLVPAQAQDTGGDQVFRLIVFGQLCPVLGNRNPSAKDRAEGCVRADFFCNVVQPKWRAQRVLDTRRWAARGRNRKVAYVLALNVPLHRLRGNADGQGVANVQQMGGEFPAALLELLKGVLHSEDDFANVSGFLKHQNFIDSMSYKVGIVGATGAVGQEIISLLRERNFPVAKLYPLASKRSAGKTITVGGESFTIGLAEPDAFAELDFAIFSAGGGVSRDLAPEAVKRGCCVIDNSSAFRMEADAPLVIPEINAHALAGHKGIIANPNCSTAIALMALYPLHKAFGLRRFFASTYQAVSGTGAEAITELENQTRAWANGEESQPSVYPHPIAFNVLPHVDAFLDSGYTKEEMKMLNEGRKIMSLPGLQVSCTCVRVPVFRAHSISIDAEFEQPVDVAKAREAIAAFPGSEVCDEPEKLRYPMPRDYSGKVKCGVGRIRKNSALDNGLALWVSGDQLWKGAALNAIQIAEALHERGGFKF